MPEVKSCCGCISLRAGTITFGVLSLIGSILSLISLVYGLNEMHNRFEENRDYEDYYEPIHEQVAVSKTVPIAMIVLCVIFALLSILMICGAAQRNTCILMTWIVILWIGIVADCISLISVPFVYRPTSEEKLIDAAKYFVNGVFVAYQLLVVHSYRQEILSEKKSGTPVFEA